MAFDDQADSAELFIDDEELMKRMHITSQSTLYRYLHRDGLPYHQVKPRSPRLYLWSEVQAWVRSRCTSPGPGQVA